MSTTHWHALLLYVELYHTLTKHNTDLQVQSIRVQMFMTSETFECETMSTVSPFIHIILTMRVNTVMHDIEYPNHLG